jgi:polyisoprenoid-binding protein YceI
MRTLLCALFVLPLLFFVGGCNKDSENAKGGQKDAPKKEAPQGKGDSTGSATKEAKANPVAIKDGKAALSADNTQIHFIGTKPDGKHDGGFSTFTGTLELNEKGDAPKALSLDIDAASLFTDTDMLTGHLKTKDFFDVAQFPKATFASTKIEPGKDGDHDVSGKLTLHGQTKEITFPIKLLIGKNMLTHDRTLTGDSTFTINRQDFGMTYGPGRVDDTVTIKVQVGVAGK